MVMQPAAKEKEQNPSDLSWSKDMDLSTLDEAELSNSDRTTSLKQTNVALHVVIIYAIFGTILCVLLSDSFLSFLNIPFKYLAIVQSGRAWICVALTLPLLYFLIKHNTLLLLLSNQQLSESKEKVARLNRVHQVLGETNHVILRIRDREQLLREVCNIVHQQGKFPFIWIGLEETECSLPEIIVSAGQETTYLQELFEGFQSSSASERGEPALSALRKRQHVVVNDVSSYSKAKFSWQTRALHNGYNSIASFPLKTSSGITGVFTLYSHEANVFSKEEIDLLRELAADISFGLSEIEQKEQLYYAANYDVITNLPNHQLFEDRLNQAIARAYHDKRFVGVSIVELPELAKITSAHGQAASDKLLQETGKHLSQLVRDGDTVARVGKNEIAIMLSDVAEVHDVAIVMHKLLSPFSVHLSNQDEVQVHPHAGIAVYPRDGGNAVTLTKNATAALRNSDQNEITEYAFYSKELSSGVKYNQRIREELSHALERKEFSLYYQPIVNLASRQIIGVEALTRWRNKKLGEVSPVQFIAVAEEMDIIMPISEWILKNACSQLMHWKTMGFNDLSLTVNISVKQLMHPELIPSMQKVFAKIKFNPLEYALAIEIPESALLSESAQLKEILQALKNLGLSVYIDDFGTGYSSLSYLHQLPIDALKIDSMFVRALGKDQNIKTLIKGIIAFAKGLEIKTIAEGVETDKQFKLLHQLGCSLGQGYFFSPPVLPKEIKLLLDKNI
jgi:diguanylate cyclase (GGDEF)-like protein